MKTPHKPETIAAVLGVPGRMRPTGRQRDDTVGRLSPTPTAESLAAECWLRAVALTKVKAFRWFGWQRSMPLVFSKSRSRPHPLSLTPPRSGPPLAITTFHY